MSSQQKYNLTKNEVDRLGNLLMVARMQEELLNSITSTYKFYIVGEVFERLKVDAKLFSRSAINLQTGELIINEEEEKPEVQKVELKGEVKNAN